MAEVEYDNLEELNYADEEDKGMRIVTCTQDVYIREKASKNSKPLGVISCGEKIAVLDEVDQWYKHDRGWSMSEFFK